MEVQNPNTSETANNKATTAVRTYLKRLDIERESLESELSGVVSELTSGSNPIGIDTPLIDAEGYPRSDIDIYRARTLRKQYHELSINLKEIMKKIEGGLNKISAVDTKKDDEIKARRAPKPKPKFVNGKWVVQSSKSEDIPNSNAAINSQSQSSTIEQNSSMPMIPFAILDSVSPSSPASEAGLHEGDLIVKFGDATSSNHKNLSLVATIVSNAASDKLPIEVVILRRKRMNSMHDVSHDVEAAIRDTLVLNVRPKAWEGRGLLGCHVVLYNEVTEASYVER